MISKIVADDIMNFFYYLSVKVSLRQKINMKCLNLIFSEKYKN